MKSEIKVMRDGGVIYEGRDAIELFRAATLKTALKLLSVGITPTHGFTMKRSLELTAQYTGQKYKRTEVQRAIADLTVWIETMKSAIPVEVETECNWKLLYPGVSVGALSDIFLDSDPRPAREQANERYIGGWFPTKGLTLRNDLLISKYKEDPPLRLVAWTMLRKEKLMLFEAEYVAVVQKDGSYEIARMD